MGDFRRLKRADKAKTPTELAHKILENADELESGIVFFQTKDSADYEYAIFSTPMNMAQISLAKTSLDEFLMDFFQQLTELVPTDRE